MTTPVVRFLSHTADAGVDVWAPTLPGLFDAAARGMGSLLAADEDAPMSRSRSTAGPSDSSTEAVHVQAADAAELLARWLRELLFHHEVLGLEYAGAEFERLEDADAAAGARASLTARVSFRAAGRPAREIKGVTYHGLAVEQDGTGWRARVIFDV